MFLLKYLVIGVGCLPLRNQRKRSFTSSYIHPLLCGYLCMAGWDVLPLLQKLSSWGRKTPSPCSLVAFLGWVKHSSTWNWSKTSSLLPFVFSILKILKILKIFTFFLPPLRHRATHPTPQQTSTPVFLRCPPSTAAARIITAPRRARRRPTGPTASWVSAGGRCACCPGLPRSILPLFSAPGHCAGAREPKSKISSPGGSGS